MDSWAVLRSPRSYPRVEKFDTNPLLADRVVHFARKRLRNIRKGLNSRLFPAAIPGSRKIYLARNGFHEKHCIFSSQCIRVRLGRFVRSGSWYGGCDATQRNGNVSNDGTNDHFGACLGG